MKLAIYDSSKKKTGESEMPGQFSECIREDLIRRAVLSEQSQERQAYGAHSEAGKRSSSELSKRRRKYRGCYGFGISRVNRKIHSRRGTRFHWVGAFSPQTVGGRRAHAPKAEKKWTQKINKKESFLAIRSAISAGFDRVVVAARGHNLPKEYPFILDSSVEGISRTKDVQAALVALGFEEELSRCLLKKVRAGIGKMRGRRYNRKKGILLVVSSECALEKAARNVPGVDIVHVDSLRAQLLAPGAHPGRVALWTQKAVDIVKEKKLFI